MVDASIPILPIKNDIINISNINISISSIPIPPMVKTIDMIGRLDTTSRKTILIDDISFPIIISPGVSVVVSKISSVCFSRSPAMLPAVNDGIRNITVRISMLTSM